MAFQFETGAFRHPALASDQPEERRWRLTGAAKHSLQKLLRARGVHASLGPGVPVLTSMMIHMPQHCLLLFELRY
jgi:hypothetical protein